jgi:hypothetical protein
MLRAGGTTMLRQLWLGLGVAAIVAGAAAAAGPSRTVMGHRTPYGLITFPNAPGTCGLSLKVRFITCVPQAEILATGQALAQKTNRKVLLGVGANWCGPCHVLYWYLNGGHADNEPAEAGSPEDAKALGEYAGSHFVLVEINTEARDTRKVLKQLGIKPPRYIPSYYVLDADGAKPLPLGSAAIKKPGAYSRTRMLRVLQAAAEPPQVAAR